MPKGNKMVVKSRGSGSRKPTLTTPSMDFLEFPPELMDTGQDSDHRDCQFGNKGGMMGSDSGDELSEDDDEELKKKKKKYYALLKAANGDLEILKDSRTMQNDFVQLQFKCPCCRQKERAANKHKKK